MELHSARHSISSLESVPDDELLRRLGDLVSRSRRVEADLVQHVGEVEERRLYAREASSSMFTYCTERLHLSEAEAYLRITVARAAREHPPLLTMLADGRLHLSGIAKLLPILTRENRDGLLERATHRSKRQILELVAEFSPRPDAPSFMHKLPQSRLVTPPAATQGSVRRAAAPLELGPDGAAAASGSTATRRTNVGGAESFELRPNAVGTLPAPEATTGSGRADIASPVLGPDRVEPSGSPTPAPRPVSHTVLMAAPPRPAVVQPLSPGRYRVQFTASAELHGKLERLQSLMRSEVPDGDLSAIIEAAVTEKLERIEARRYAKTSASRKELADTDTSPHSRHIPAAVRRAVRERDGNRCRYVDERGRRCGERDPLELHHRHPFGMGGDHSPTNLRLLCPTHNQYLAELDYGQATLKKRQSARETPALPPPSPPG
jgi:hypothetical protein